MEAKLVVVGGKQAGKEIPISGAKFLIGRGEDCQLRPQSDLVSRRHCAILVEAGTVAVRDFNSRNGTLVNGERIKGDRELKTGDRLKIGPLEFDVQLSVPVAGKKKPKVRNIQEAAARTVESAVGGSEDLDISSWLEDQEEEEAPLGARSTDTLPLSTTSTSVTGSKDVPATAAESAEEDPEKNEPEIKIVGQFDRNKKPMAESSRAAAADVLKKLFEGKP
jgi:pSer/pThr/pTyr-binding forkhead associated (FHA) protein